MNQPFGAYKPKSNTTVLRLLTSLGLSRGKINKWVTKRWHAKKYTKVDTIIRGIRFRLNIQLNTTDGKLLSTSKFYDKREIKSLASAFPNGCPSNSVFVDIGANSGYYSLSLAKLGCGKIFAIEPNPPTLELLRGNVELNNFNSTITIVPNCVGKSGEVDFYQSGDLGGASVIKEDHLNAIPLQVQSRPLVDILKENEVIKVDAIKIDVEGFEDRVLEEFFRPMNQSLWPKVLVIEHCHSKSWVIDIVHLILTLGYEVVHKTRANTIIKKSN